MVGTKCARKTWCGHCSERPAKLPPSDRRKPQHRPTAAPRSLRPLRPARTLATNGHGKNGANGHGPHFKNGASTANGANGSHAKNGANLDVKIPLEAGPKPRTPQAELRLQQIKARLAEAKDLAIRSVSNRGSTQDRLVVMVRDPYWLHAYWELSRRSIQRAEAAMGQHWHAARPVLRVHELARNGTTSAARQAVRDIAIHGGVNNWYIDVQNPPKSYQLEIGYLAPVNRFYCLARSNVVSTPAPGSARHVRPQLGRSGQGLRSGLRHDRRRRRAGLQRRLEGRPRGAPPPSDGRIAVHPVRLGCRRSASRTSASMSIPS